ncbi:uncharacterized protein EV420DRAFT_1479677 [Desarmillaria tabescens]|uniref:Uncharacterized protein n=1 Tax=Armillaria tabescens TaxID=1929756 RepID=A0AA39KEM9_ARMTA|nr:uncharacterized protein EV420DRAFT_1479677 [Desarmillaria tabescens]KAK0458394.1 hypothetical protein EV420DRAFT_1479677 [Desarmillaria tabescens]
MFQPTSLIPLHMSLFMVLFSFWLTGVDNLCSLQMILFAIRALLGYLQFIHLDEMSCTQGCWNSVLRDSEQPMNYDGAKDQQCDQLHWRWSSAYDVVQLYWCSS